MMWLSLFKIKRKIERRCFSNGEVFETQGKVDSGISDGNNSQAVIIPLSIFIRSQSLRRIFSEKNEKHS